MIKNIERVAPLLRIQIRAVQARLHGVREDKPPKMASVTYELIVDTDTDDHELEPMHKNVRTYGAICNTVAEATRVEGRILPSPNRDP